MSLPQLVIFIEIRRALDPLVVSKGETISKRLLFTFTINDSKSRGRKENFLSSIL